MITENVLHPQISTFILRHALKLRSFFLTFCYCFTKLRDFRLSPRRSWELCSFWILEPWRWDRLVAPKNRLETTATCCVRTWKSVALVFQNCCMGNVSIVVASRKYFFFFPDNAFNLN